MRMQSSNNYTISTRNNGYFSISDQKVIITTTTGQSFVLIEDVSSISWKRITYKSPNWVFLIGSLAIMLSGLFLPSSTPDYLAIFVLMMLVGATLIQLSLKAKKDQWDDVIIETKGGMLMAYSVDIGKGSDEVRKIEVQLM